MKNAPTCRKLRGFTLIELLVTLGIAAILLSVGAPAFGDYIANQRVRGAAQTMFTALSLARAEAIKRNENVEIKATDKDWAKGWQVGSMLDQADELLLGKQDALNRVAISSTADSVSFKPNGRPTTSSTITICDDHGSDAVTQRIVTIDSSGFPNIALGGPC